MFSQTYMDDNESTIKDHYIFRDQQRNEIG